MINIVFSNKINKCPMCGAEAIKASSSSDRRGMVEEKSFACGLVVSSFWREEKDKRFFHVEKWCPPYSEKDYPDNGKGFYEN